MAIQTGSTILATDISARLGYTINAGTTALVSQALKSGTQRGDLIKPADVAKLYLIQNGQFILYPQSDYEVVNLARTVSDPNYGEWDLIGNFYGNVNIEYNEWVSSVRFPIAGSGSNSTYRPGAFVLTKQIDFTNINKMSIKFYAYKNGNSQGLDSSLAQIFKICIFTSRNKFKGHTHDYWIDSWDNTNVLKAAIRNSTSLTNNTMDTSNLFPSGPYTKEIDTSSLSGNYYVQVAGGGWGNNWYLLVNEWSLSY